MAKNAPPELHLAVFGEAGSGKTTLLSSYFGHHQSHRFEMAKKFSLEAVHPPQGNALLSKYHSMERGNFPLSTNDFGAYEFSLHVKDLKDEAMRIHWYDYPGGWWIQGAADADAQRIRTEGLRKLLSSHVGMLAVDGARLGRDGGNYLRKLFDQFRSEVRRQHRAMSAEGLDTSQYPTQWIVCLTKCDLPGVPSTAEEFYELVARESFDEFHGLFAEMNRDDLTGISFLLLSAAKGDERRVADVHKTIGLELIAPIAILSTLEDIAKHAPKGTFWTGLREGLSLLFRLGGLLRRIATDKKVLAKLPPKLSAFMLLVDRFGDQKLAELLEMGLDAAREQQEWATRKKRATQAAVSALMGELKTPGAQNYFFRRKSNRLERTSH